MKLRTDIALDSNRSKQTHKIAKFWDKLSQPWQQIWGAHIHHGYYEENAMYSPQVAQDLLIDKLAAYLKISPHDKLLDVGCGLGGSSIHLARKFQASVTGITISPQQVQLANASAKKANLSTRINFQIEDALSMKGFANKQFDIVWSLESCEQFFDKLLFIQQVHRILKPGGQFMLATWCASADEYEHSKAIKYYNLCKAFDLPYMPTMSFYHQTLCENGFKIMQSLDWTKQVEKSWDHGVEHLKNYSLFQLLKLGGLRGFRFVKQLNLMRQAFRENEIKYGIFFAEKIGQNQCQSHTMTS